MKLISFAVPCYNSEKYMRHCIESLLIGENRVEIILVNDGSSDNTGSIADEYCAKYPDIVKVIHKENGGHGSGIMAGLEAASGLYYKVIDSDDWADAESLLKILDLIEKFEKEQNLIDLIVCNYVYEHEGSSPHTVHYRGIFPKNRVFSWDECGIFDISRYMIMHSVFYRTELVKNCDLQIPLHTFYVDNIYVFHPMPFVKTMYYLNVDFYRYFIGRPDQSVNEQVMIRRIDQQIRVNKLMIDYYVDECKNIGRKCRQYMLNHLEIVTVVSTVMCLRSGSAENMDKKNELWHYIKEKDMRLYKKPRHGILGNAMHLPGKSGRKISLAAYRLSQKIVGFN